VLGPKVDGGWFLHNHTKDMPLDFFVLFSSASAIIGNLGQSNYAAANSFLDGLARYRRSIGLPALSVNWGPWAEVGMAASTNEDAVARWAEGGISLIGLEEGMDVMGESMRCPAAHYAALMIKWKRYGRQYPDGERPAQLLDLIPAKKKKTGRTKASKNGRVAHRSSP